MPRIASRAGAVRRGGAITAVLAVGLLLAACGTEDDPATTDPPAPAPVTESPVPGSPQARWADEVNAFLETCEGGAEQWRQGEVGYPRALPVAVGEGTTYVATLDIRGSDAPPGKPIPGPEPGQEPVFVQCAVAARLVTAGDAVEVDSDDWALRTFTPSGMVDWSWAVSGTEIGTQDVRLELRPAVRTQDGLVAVGDPQTTSFVTAVTVTGSMFQEAEQYLQDNWPAITGIAVLVTGAVLAVVRFRDELAEALRGGRGGRRAEEDADPEPAQPGPEPGPPDRAP